MTESESKEVKGANREAFCRSRKMRTEIVVVEDKEEDRAILKLALEECGYRVKEVRDARKVASVLSAQKAGWCPEAVIVDLILEGSSGYEVIRNLKPRFEGRRVPIVVVSALASDEDIYEASSAGADAFVRKPFAPDELLDALYFSLDNARKPITERKMSLYVRR